MKNVFLTVKGMSCLGCMNRVQMLLEEVEGVEEVSVDLSPGSARILCEDEVQSSVLVDSVNKNSIYRAAFDREEKVFSE